MASKSSFSKCEFVSEYAQSTSNEYHCPVCYDILQQPFLTTCCGIHFCKVCIEFTKKKSKKCPLCEKKPINAIADKRFGRILDELQVYCLHKEHGCAWVGTLGELREHLADEFEGCQYAPMSWILVSDDGNHDEEVPEIEEHPEETLAPELQSSEDQLKDQSCSYFCKFCDFSSSLEDDVEQHYTTCPNFPIPCPNSCDKKVKRCKLDNHLLTCPNVVVPCTFSELGCKETMKRSELQQHIEVNVIHHQVMICEAFKEIKEENEMLKEDNRLLQRNIQMLQKTQSTADYWISGYKLMAEEVKKTHWREYLFSLAESATNIPGPVSPVIFKWSNYEALLQKAKRKYVCFSFRPFYTQRGGYKMQICLYPNGTGHGKGTHVFLSCSIIRGEYDNELSWPFKGTVEATILNQVTDDDHYSKEILESHSAKPTKVNGQPADGQVRNDSGWEPIQFIPLVDIEHFTDTKQYRMNDTVYLRVTATVT